MTCVAYKNGVIAADSLAVYDESITSFNVKKIRRIGPFLAGMAGNIPSWLSIEEWFLSEQRRDRFENYDFDLMLVHPEGRIFKVDQRGIMDEVHEKFWSIGSGALGAMCAMECGKSAPEAVRAAIKRSWGCGGKVRSLRFK